MNWQVGDRVILTALTHHSDLNGTEVTILSALRPHWSVDYMVHEIDIVPPHGYSAMVHPKSLCPIPDDKHKRFRIGLVKTEWSDCAFNPMVEIER